MKNFHSKIYKKLDYFHKKEDIPHILFHGDYGSGKKTILIDFLNKIYNNNITPQIFSFSTLKFRQKMDRRRLEAAHLKYALLQTVAEYPNIFSDSDMVVSTDIQDTLQQLTSKYYSAFQSRYSGI